jgi:Tfp pilus assembly protein PilF
MSLILDALKRKRPTQDPGDRSAGAREAHSDAVLSTLGYRQPQARRAGLSLKMLLLYGAAAMAIGFVGLSLLILLFAPPERLQPAPVTSSSARAMGQPPATNVPSSQTAVPTPPTRVPSPLAVPPLSAEPARGLSASVSQGAPAPAPSKLVVPPASQPRAAVNTQSTPQRPVVGAEPERATAPQAARATARTARTAPASEAPQREVPPVVMSAPTPATPNHFALGLYYQRIADYDNALAQYRAFLEQNDASAEGHNNLGLLLLDRQQLDDAVRQFERAVAIDPRHVTAHNNLGVAFMRLNRSDSAAAEFRIAMTMQPRNVESIVNLALVQKAAGRTADARDLLHRAVTIDPRNPGSHYNLAVLADEGGENAAAVEHYRAFLKYGAVSHNDLVVRVRARIAALAG